MMSNLFELRRLFIDIMRVSKMIEAFEAIESLEKEKPSSATHLPRNVHQKR